MEAFRPVCPPFPPASDGEGYVLPVRDNHLLVRATSSSVTLCQSWPKNLERPETSHLLGWIDDKPCHTMELKSQGTGVLAQQGPPGHAYRELRSLYGLLPEGEYAAAVTAVEVLHFERTYRLCPSCGAPLHRQADRWLKECLPCGVQLEPRTQPTVMGLIHDGARVLLAQPRGLPKDMFSLPATTVGPGESLEFSISNFVEQALGVQLGEVYYFSSQPWPFPDRLIIGLFGSPAAGELKVDKERFTAARWFHIDDLPALPAPLSLARRMADWYAQLPRLQGKPVIPKGESARDR